MASSVVLDDIVHAPYTEPQDSTIGSSSSEKKNFRTWTWTFFFYEPRELLEPKMGQKGSINLLLCISEVVENISDFHGSCIYVMIPDEMTASLNFGSLFPVDSPVPPIVPLPAKLSGSPNIRSDTRK